MDVQKVAIIGAGVSGLASIKSCLESGLKPTCFEQRSWLGGTWNYSSEVGEYASVHKSTITNTCKQTTCFSDYPIPLEYPNYIPQHLMQQYLEKYSEHFKLQAYIRFNQEVTQLARTTDHIETGKWVISYRNLAKEKGEIKREVFDAVMVCNGHYWSQVIPEFPGKELFRGVQLHSGDYRTFHPHVGKRVLVVGVAHSAGDIASELSFHASQVYMSTRNGGYILQRTAEGGHPAEFGLSRFAKVMPTFMFRYFLTGLQNDMYNFNNLGLQPTQAFERSAIAINDTLVHRIITGDVKVYDDVDKIGENSVTFVTGEVLQDIDVIVYATGFKYCFPFAKDLLPLHNNVCPKLYKHVFLPEAEHQTLAFIGVTNARGPFHSIIEIQTRVAVEVFKGKCILPDKAAMLGEIEHKEAEFNKTGLPSTKFTMVDNSHYIDELAAMIGAKPDIWALFKKDPIFALKCFFVGPIVPAQYRLQGPQTWHGARDTILSIKKQYQYPLMTRKCQKPRRNIFSYFYFFWFAVVVTVVLFYIIHIL